MSATVQEQNTDKAFKVKTQGLHHVQRVSFSCVLLAIQQINQSHINNLLSID